MLRDMLDLLDLLRLGEALGLRLEDLDGRVEGLLEDERFGLIDLLGLGELLSMDLEFLFRSGLGETLSLDGDLLLSIFGDVLRSLFFLTLGAGLFLSDLVFGLTLGGVVEFDGATLSLCL